MKKFYLLFAALICGASSASAGKYRLNVAEEDKAQPVVAKKSSKRMNFELMEPVKLRNPQRNTLELQAGGPKFTVYAPVKTVYKPSVQPEMVIEEEVIVERPVVKTDVKKEVKPAPVAKPVEKPAPVVEEKTVANTEEKTQFNPVVPMPVANEENRKEEVPVIAVEEEKTEPKTEVKQEEVADFSQTDKNIEEAKKLLQIAERLANSVIEEDEPAVITPKKVEEVKKSTIETSVETPKFVIKFANGVEDLKKVDEKKFIDIVPAVKDNPEVTVKIISYYTSKSGRNVAFSRLLNARKILLEKEVPTSQIIIMVLEDETEKALKADTIEVFCVR